MTERSPLRCNYCGKSHGRDSCSFCGHLYNARASIDRAHKGESGPYGNLSKLAAHIAAGMHEGLIKAMGIGGFHPTQEELDKATVWAVEQFRNTKYILRKEPNGTMTRSDIERDEK